MRALWTIAIGAILAAVIGATAVGCGCGDEHGEPIVDLAMRLDMAHHSVDMAKPLD